MLEWTEVRTLPAGAAWGATAAAADGTELQVMVWGERPGVRRRLVLAAAAPQGPGPALWQLRTKGRYPTAAELVDAAHAACQGSAEWWAVPYPWRGDFEAPSEPPADLEYFEVGGYLIGPIPPEVNAFLIQLAVGTGSQVAAGPPGGAARNA